MNKIEIIISSLIGIVLLYIIIAKNNNKIKEKVGTSWHNTLKPTVVNTLFGEINIESDLEINKIHVYQMDGKLIKIVTTQNFNLERNAIYYLKVFTNSGNAVKTIVVQ